MSKDGTGISDRLRSYRSLNEYGDKEHHSICDEAADRIDSLLDVLEESLFWLDGWLLPMNIAAWSPDQYEAALSSAKRIRSVFAGVSPS